MCNFSEFFTSNQRKNKNKKGRTRSNSTRMDGRWVTTHNWQQMGGKSGFKQKKRGKIEEK